RRNDVTVANAATHALLRVYATSAYGTDALIRFTQVPALRPEFTRQVYRDLLARSTPADVRADAWLGLADSSLSGGDAGEAQRAAEGFLKDAPAGDPRAVRAQLILAQALQAQGQTDKALTAMDTFPRQYPKDAATPTLELNRGHLLADAKRFDQAQQAFEVARRADDPAVAAEAEFRLGEVLQARGDYAAAVSHYL